MGCSNRKACLWYLCLLASTQSVLLLVRGQEVPQLWQDVPSNVAAAALDSSSLKQPCSARAYMAQYAETSSAKVVGIDRNLITSDTLKLRLELPGSLTVTAVRRTDLDSMASAVMLAPAAPGVKSAGLGIGLWMGEVVGAKGPFSSVTLLVAENGGVYGNIRLYNKRTHTFRTFMVSPVTKADSNDADCVATASFSKADAGTIKAALYPELDTSKHLVVQSVEPDYASILAKQPHSHVVASNNNTHTAGNTVHRSGGKVKPTDQHTPSLGADGQGVLVAPVSRNSLAAQMEASAGADVVAAVGKAGFLAAANTWFNTASIGIMPAATPVVGSTPGANNTGRRLLQTGNTRIDLLVVYTPALAAFIGGVAALENKIRMTVAEQNRMFANSGKVPITMNLVGIRQVEYVERVIEDAEAPAWCRASNVGSALCDAQKGVIPGLHEMRDELGADLVAFWIYGTGCGLAGVGPNVDEGSYAVIGRDCLIDTAHAHEVGHNQGCLHNYEDSPDYGYANGWRRCDRGNARNFKTVMSYHCTGAGQISTELRVFSNLRTRYSGVAVGDATKANCARKLTETRQQIAEHRPQRVGVMPLQTTAVIDFGSDAQFPWGLFAPSLTFGTQVIISNTRTTWEYMPDAAVRVAGTNVCLDVKAAGTTNGTAVQVFGCNGTPAQKWFMDTRGRLHPYLAPIMCLEIPFAFPSAGQGAELWECGRSAATRDDRNQIWTSSMFNFWVLDTNKNGGNQALKSFTNDVCMDVYAFDYTNGAPVVMWPCNGLMNQLWSADISGMLRSVHNTNKCLTAQSARAGASVFISDCRGTTSQRWFMDPMNRIRPYNSANRCLEITGESLELRARMSLADCGERWAQKWLIHAHQGR